MKDEALMRSPVTVGAANPASYLREARTKVTPERFAVAIDAIWQKAETGDVQAFNAVVPYLTGKLAKEEHDGGDNVLANILKVVAIRQREIEESRAMTIELLPDVGQEGEMAE